MLKKLLNGIMILTLVLQGLLIVPFITQAADDCLSYNLDTPHSDAELRQMLAVCNAESAATSQQLKDQQARSSSLAGDIALLNSLISKAAQQITIKNKIIGQLSGQITQKQQTIETLSEKLQREDDSLGQILRKKNEIDMTTLPEMMLSQGRISDFFLDIDNFETLNKALQESENTVRGIKQQTSTEKATLEAQKVEQSNLKNQIEAQKAQTEAQQADKKVLLNQSKSQEKSYQQLLAEHQSQAAKISAALFKLAGGSKAIPFGDAYKYAQVASTSTGVRPAFILAILKQESNLGTDQGGCYVTDLNTGAGIRAKNSEAISTVMKAPRDTAPFKNILAALGYSTTTTQVSCPEKINGSYMGYGGAMGPTQFIPSTWMLYSSRIAQALNEPTSNPWNPQDAVMATALYMEDLGANDSSQEKTAACEYYSGHGCTTSASRSYGSSVLKIEASIQSDINIINAAN